MNPMNFNITKKIDELITSNAKLAELLGKKNEEIEEKKTVKGFVIAFAIIGAIAVMAAVAFVVYRCLNLDNYDDFDDFDDFDDYKDDEKVDEKVEDEESKITEE